ncbi:MAG: hypothetical protein JKP90_06930 [Desulfofustis sp. PB-SRB1]|nr:hypothetical protein [Desulfofustis sp. PB-SRB1]
MGEYSATGAELRTYGYHPGAPWSTNPLFVQENGIYYYYLNDPSGHPPEDHERQRYRGLGRHL